MAELWRHTDEDGYRLEMHARPDGELLAVMVHTGHPTRGSLAADLAEVDGRRLLAALQRYYDVPGADQLGLTEGNDHRG